MTRRPELLELATHLRCLAVELPAFDRRPLLWAAAYYERSSTVTNAHGIQEGDVFGTIMLDEQIATSDNGRCFSVHCTACGESWCMFGATARRAFLKGRNVCRVCRKRPRTPPPPTPTKATPEQIRESHAAAEAILRSLQRPR